MANELKTGDMVLVWWEKLLCGGFMKLVGVVDTHVILSGDGSLFYVDRSEISIWIEGRSLGDGSVIWKLV
ncbi:MAG: hypothetical protein ISR99_01955 [Parcubacteria group bacterium]|nr:hypothetical protein [Parcubacteria group bacterium]